MASGGLRVRWDRVVLLALVVLGTVSLLITSALGSATPTSSEAPASTPSTSPANRAVQQAPPPCSAPTRRVIRQAPAVGEPRTVALTFDDGPGAATDSVLRILEDKQVRATFFVIGRQVASHPDRVRRAAAAGHNIEDHSWSHPAPSTRQGWQSSEVTRQISRTQAEVAKVVGRAPCFFRPPEGVVKGSQQATYAANVSLVLWSVDTRDWAHPKASAASQIRQNAQAGLTQRHPIVLLHDGGGRRAGTVAALPSIIDDYRSHGYVFVTMDGRQ